MKMKRLKRTIVIREHNGINWQTTEFDLEKLLEEERITTENNIGWVRVVILKKYAFE